MFAEFSGRDGEPLCAIPVMGRRRRAAPPNPALAMLVDDGLLYAYGYGGGGGRPSTGRPTPVVIMRWHDAHALWAIP